MNQTEIAFFQEFEPNVDAGMAFLDGELGSGRWEDKVNLDHLNMNSDHCIVGQLCGSWLQGLQDLRIPWEGEGGAVALGFTLDHGDTPGDRIEKFFYLRKVWCAKIQARRAALALEGAPNSTLIEEEGDRELVCA